MTLDEILNIADGAYPDGLIRASADEIDVGDGLAAFIARELRSVYDEDDDAEDQLSYAMSAMGTARGQLDCVERAFMLAMERPSQTLDSRQLATVLAALRLWQAAEVRERNIPADATEHQREVAVVRAGEDMRRRVPDHFFSGDNNNEETPLTAEEIDGLCERLNR